MSLFRLIKYSSILYYLGKHRDKLVRSAAVLLFAFVTSLIYEDVRVYLSQQHPGTLVYALIVKIVIVYGSLVFVLLQFRGSKNREADGEARAAAVAGKHEKTEAGSTPTGKRKPASQTPRDRLDELSDLDQHDRLKSRYDRILEGKKTPEA